MTCSRAASVTIWSIVVFFILFALLSKFAWPQIREGLDKRGKAIAHDKHEAVLAKREADKLRGELAAKMQEANDRIRDMMDKATRDAAAAAAEEIARGKGEVASERAAPARAAAGRRRRGCTRCGSSRPAWPRSSPPRSSASS
ncbi:MAG: ATP synthase F0 subunit B [Gemmataceae bacterium]